MIQGRVAATLSTASSHLRFSVQRRVRHARTSPRRTRRRRRRLPDSRVQLHPPRNAETAPFTRTAAQRNVLAERSREGGPHLSGSFPGEGSQGRSGDRSSAPQLPRNSRAASVGWSQGRRPSSAH